MGVGLKMDELKVFSLLVSFLLSVYGQGLRCDTPADCAVDEYNPYCSKWGYCTWTPSFGDTGPPQSKGAVEDGTRGNAEMTRIVHHRDSFLQSTRIL
eukprot:TRINITY_DN13222_c0_g1_i1.p1 TRINITY_DN13222_c0_g1~~TRINITY_DN13222_c0_g1_i1.p1  ORF type:complete len:105 (+),score=18.47 TRINITY_DN13222_c0_g1_i1:26-316(+)